MPFSKHYNALILDELWHVANDAVQLYPLEAQAAKITSITEKSRRPQSACLKLSLVMTQSSGEGEKVIQLTMTLRAVSGRAQTWVGRNRGMKR